MLLRYRTQTLETYINLYLASGSKILFFSEHKQVRVGMSNTLNVCNINGAYAVLQIELLNRHIFHTPICYYGLSYRPIIDSIFL